MKRILCFIYLTFCLSFLNAGPLQNVTLTNFKLSNGQVAPAFKVAYRVFGTINRDSSNIIVFPTWFGGKTSHIGKVIGPGKLVDTTRYAVIAVAAPGNGESETPLSLKDVFSGEFPSLTIRDFVHSQYRMLTERLGIKHVKGLIGGSMGGMQVFEWMVRYPGFIDKAIPYVGTPKTAVSDRLSHRFRLNLIRQGWRQHTTQDSIIAQIQLFTMIMAHSPSYLNRKYSWPEMQNRINGIMHQPHLSIPLPGYLIGLQAMLQHDISAGFDHRMELAARAVKAQCLIIVSQSDHLVNPRPALNFARLIHARTLILDDDGGHLAVSSNMKTISAAINKFLSD